MMLGHPGGEEHSRYLIELSFLPPPARWLDMGAGDGSTVRLLKSLGYEAEGIDLHPRGEDVTAGDYLHPPYEPGCFDGIVSQCSFYVSGNVCGCMAAGSCLIAWFTGKPDADRFESEHHKSALGEFTQWFTEEMELEYMGIDCRDIVGTSPAKKVQYCPGIIAATYEKCMEILENRGLV